MISIDLSGHLGNQMFQYAVCRSIAERQGFNYFIKKYNENSQLFDSFNLDGGVNDNKTNYMLGEGPGVFRNDVLNANDGTHLSGYFQFEQYFENNEINVKKWFTMKLNNDQQIIYDDIRRQYPIEEYCYVHFRGGDYNWDSPTNWILPKVFYEKAKSEIRKVSPNIKFIITTNDVELAKSYFDGDIILSNKTSNYQPDGIRISNDYKVDFRLLQDSKFIILSNSTFSWWAAWLGEQEHKIAPIGWLYYGKEDNLHCKSKKFKYV